MKRNYKRLFLAVFIAMILSLLCISISAADSEVVLGDMNGDSVVNIDDAIYLLKHTMLPSRYPVSQSADVNGSSDVNIDDAIYLLKHTMLPSRYPIMSPGSYYTITWENGDGTVLKTTWCEADKIPAFGNQTPTKPSDATYDYTFSGWSPEITVATEDTTYVAVYTKASRASYTITYNTNGGANAPASQRKTRGTAINLSAVVPTSRGKVFTGWLCANDGKTYAAGASFTLDADAKLYAIWANTCSTCQGVGSITSTGSCGTCYGDGIEEKETYVNAICTNCSGLGKTYTNCSSCKGFGALGNCSCSCGNTWSPNTTGSRVCSKCGRTVAMQTIGNCGWCRGEGGTYSTCYRCGGDGVMAVPNGTTSSTCSSCYGSGSKTNTTKCATCKGDKAIVTYDTYTVTLKDGNSTISTVSVTVKSSYKLTVPTKNGYTFLGWFDALENGKQYADASGTPTTVWLDFSDKVLYARWRKNCDVTLTQNISEAGTVSGGGNYKYGNTVTVQAMTNTGYTFLGWYANDSLVSSSTSYTFTISGNKSLEARWQISSYTISVNKNIFDAGTISGTGSYDYGTSVTVTATTNVGYTFLGWYKNDSKVSSNESYTFTALEDKTLEARWRISTYSVSLNKNISTAGNVSGKGTYDYGTSVTVTATTNEGYTFLGWYKDNYQVSFDENYTFAVLNDVTLTAKWTKSYDVVLQQNISNAGSVNGDGTYDYGTSVTVTATTNVGYTFLGWYKNASKVSSNESYTFTALEDKTLEARWQINTYSVSLNKNISTAGNVSGKGTYDYGTSITVTATTNIGYTFLGWYENDSNVSSNESYTFTLSASNKVMEARWELSEECAGLADFNFTSTEEDCTIIGVKDKTKTEYIIPNCVTSISYSAFSGCTGLTSIMIPDSVTSIGSKAFSSCTSLTSITIPDSVTSIGSKAFSSCTSLTSITIPDSVTSIGSEAFSGCTSLTSITIPDSVTSIDSEVFHGTGYYYNPSNWEDGVLYIGKYLIDAEKSLLGAYQIKEGTLCIGSDAFSGCSGLTNITIPNSVTSIGREAFSGCTGLASIDIPNSVTSIENGAFVWCGGLTSITIPNSVTNIGYSAFKDCTSLTSITIPDSVPSIGNYAFEGCSGLTSITMPNSVTSIGFYAFEGCGGLTSIKYCGTQAQWDAIFKDVGWNYNTGSYTITYNYTGE